jgi:hypothetical protein
VDRLPEFVPREFPGPLEGGGVEKAVFVADLDRLPPRGERYDRLYLGSEFCHWRLPGADELRRAGRECRERGMAFSLVTPFLTYTGLRRALALVRDLPAEGGTEVIVNDLGLLEAILGTGWPGTLVAGRLLTRQRRGPGFQDPVETMADALAALRGSALDSPAFIARLGAVYGVHRFELDDLVQGVAVAALPEGARLSLYRPFLLVTATRNCPWIFDGRVWQRDGGCPQPCRGQALLMEPREGGRRLTMGGCAQFLTAEAAGGAAAAPVDRLVWQPEIPA